MRLPASTQEKIHDKENFREISSYDFLKHKEELQSNFWGMSIFTLLFALALLSILILGQNDH